MPAGNPKLLDLGRAHPDRADIGISAFAGQATMKAAMSIQANA